MTSVHDKDGWLGDLRLFQRLKDEGHLSLRVWQSLPHELLPRSSRWTSAPGSATAGCAPDT